MGDDRSLRDRARTLGLTEPRDADEVIDNLTGRPMSIEDLTGPVDQVRAALDRATHDGGPE